MAGAAEGGDQVDGGEHGAGVTGVERAAYEVGAAGAGGQPGEVAGGEGCCRCPVKLGADHAFNCNKLRSRSVILFCI